jgi:hypothetical protein
MREQSSEKSKLTQTRFPILDRERRHCDEAHKAKSQGEA